MRSLILAAAVPLALGACASAPAEVVLPSVTTTIPSRYTGVVGGYTHRVPVDPKPWRSLNEAQSPQGSGS